MGVSTNAILFYGYVWDDETTKPWLIGTDIADDEDEDHDDDEADWEDRYARLSGLAAPSEPFPDKGVDPRTGCHRTDYTKTEQAIVDSYTTYWSAKRALAEACPVEIGFHCSGSCSMPFVAIASTTITVCRGDSRRITSLQHEGKWRTEIDKFCKFMGIDVKDKELGWWLVSYWSE